MLLHEPACNAFAERKDQKNNCVMAGKNQRQSLQQQMSLVSVSKLQKKQKTRQKKRPR